MSQGAAADNRERNKSEGLFSRTVALSESSHGLYPEGTDRKTHQQQPELDHYPRSRFAVLIKDGVVEQDKRRLPNEVYLLLLILSLLMSLVTGSAVAPLAHR